MPELRMPSLGADMESGTLLEWLVHPGDLVHRGDPVAVVDTDKAAVEIESFDEGVLGAMLVDPGQRVPVGTPLATLTARPETPEGSTSVPAPEAPAGPNATAAGAPPPRKPEPRAARPPASPPIRHHAAELGVDLATVKGTGHNAAITRADVDRAAAELAGEDATDGHTVRRAHRVSPYARRLARELDVDVGRLHGTGPHGTVQGSDVLAVARPTATPEGPPEETPAPRRTIAAAMSKSKREIPHYYVATTVDMHAVTEWLLSHNREVPVSERLVPAALLLKAAAVAAGRFPDLNGFWRDDRFVPAGAVHLGVAVSVRGGPLVAPAIHDAADLDVPAMMQHLKDLVTRARRGRLTRAELADPTLTVTDLGDQGVEEVIGVIHPPQVALIGIGRIVRRPWAVDGLLGVHPVVRISLSGDHRATDGATGARFLATVDDLLQHPEEL